MVFYNFFNFLLFFLEFSLDCREGTKRSDNFYFLHSQRFPTYFSLEWSRNGIFQFFEFFSIFFEFSLARREGTKQSDNFYFLSFSAFSNIFWLGMKSYWYFSIFWIFLLFFWNFLFPIGKERNKTIVFIFSLSQPFPIYFGLEWGRNGIFQFFEFFCYFFGIFSSPSGRNETEW